METVAIKAQKRDTFGKKANSKIRKQGLIPAVLYAKDGVDHVVVIPKDLKSLVYTSEFKLAELEINGQKHKAIVRDIQFHPVSDAILHIDFLRLIDGVSLTCEVPVIFHGESPGMKEGGTLMPILRTVTLKTTPDRLVDQVSGDISGMELGSSLKVKDLEIPEGIEIMNVSGAPVCVVDIPRAAKLEEELEEEEVLAEGEEVAEGEEGEKGEKTSDEAAKEGRKTRETKE